MGVGTLVSVNDEKTKKPNCIKTTSYGGLTELK